MCKLCELEINQKATVKKVLAQGKLKRRFIDIGIIEGTEIECITISPQGNPKAFLIRGALFAIRNEDSALIKVGDVCG